MLAKPARHAPNVAAFRADMTAPHGHAGHGHAGHGHEHDHHHHHGADGHAHDHDHSPAPRRHRPYRSLLALSGGQRLALVSPLILLLWALTYWAMRAVP